jgi:hypothetical protein
MNKPFEGIHHLKEVLLSAYEHFADRRIKNIDRGTLFIVDDRSESDHGADGKLFQWFCLIFADVKNADTVTISMLGNVPKGSLVTQWFKIHKAKKDPAGISFVISRGKQGTLDSLAEAFLTIVKPGKSYSVPSYKYVCPRVARSLVRLRTALDTAWES